MEILIFDTGINQVYLTLEVVANTDKLDAFTRRMEDPKELQRKLGWMLRRAYARRFAEGGGEEGNWKDLKESTIASKMDASLPPLNKSGTVFRRLRQSGVAPAASKLIATGWLRDSYVQKAHPDHVSRIEETDEGFLVVEGSKDPKAEFHQKGTAPYTIYPKNAKKLRFIGAGGSIVYRSMVNHPGLPARPVTVSRREKSEMDEVVRQFLTTDSKFESHD
jgi:hypothetical protein